MINRAFVAVGAILIAIMFLGSKLGEAQHGPGHVTCDVKWLETGKPAAEYEKFMQDCLAAEAPDRGDNPFLEAALFFLTGVDTNDWDVVTDREIRLARYPLVAYLVNAKPCAVRLRNTENNNVWEMDFCKLTYFGRSRPGIRGDPSTSYYYWEGEGGVLCISRQWQVKENYIDTDFAKISSSCTNEVNDGIDIRHFVGGKFRGYRSKDRMVASFKYIETLLTGKPY